MSRAILQALAAEVDLLDTAEGYLEAAASVHSFSDHVSEIATKEEAKAEIGQGFLDCIEDTYHYLNQLITTVHTRGA